MWTDPARTSDFIRLRLDISYDGTDFSGWAIQPGRRTVAGVLTDALQVVLRESPRLVVAGRTDAGVHAVGQVAHVEVRLESLRGASPRHLVGDGSFSVDEQAEPAAPAAAASTSNAISTGPTTLGRLGLLRRLAGVLPADVRVRGVSVAPEGFDARFSALRRHYRYRIGTADWGVEPADRRFVLARRRTLDIGAMTLAASALIGLRDFAAFCRPREGATTIRDLQSLTIGRDGLPSKSVLIRIGGSPGGAAGSAPAHLRHQCGPCARADADGRRLPTRR